MNVPQQLNREDIQSELNCMDESSLRERLVRLEDVSNDEAMLVDVHMITSDVINADILRRIRINDPTLTGLWIRDIRNGGAAEKYCPKDSSELKWLAYYIGENTRLERVVLVTETDQEGFLNRPDVMEPFFRGLKSTSIRTLAVHFSDLSGWGSIIESMGNLINSSSSLTSLELDSCVMSDESCSALSLALGGCTHHSLRQIGLPRCGITDDQFAGIITSLGVHSQLEIMRFYNNQLGRKGCRSLASVVDKLVNLRVLNLFGNEIDDEGVEALVTGLANDGSNLQILSIGNESITNNGWMAISKLLCDTSSVNKTFHSNHTLHDMGLPDGLCEVPGLFDNLDLNSLEDKQQVAMIKIMQHHNDFDLNPFFEWDLKMLPRVLRWLERANDIQTCSMIPTLFFEKNIDQRKLSAIYRFARSKPALYIEGQLRDKAARQLQVWYRAKVSAKLQKLA